MLCWIPAKKKLNQLLQENHIKRQVFFSYPNLNLKSQKNHKKQKQHKVSLEQLIKDVQKTHEITAGFDMRYEEFNGFCRGALQK